MPNIIKKVMDACVKAEAVDLPKLAGHMADLCSNGHRTATLQVGKGSISWGREGHSRDGLRKSVYEGVLCMQWGAAVATRP